MKRINTGFMDGKYGLPAWHLEWYETLKQWVIREIKEEISIDVLEDDLEMVHNSHRVKHWERVYFDFYFKVKKYSWNIANGEPDKCTEITFVDPQSPEVIPYLRDIFKKIEAGERFSEIYIT
jgi:ADP-ribose pyrophosphatase YjhB (NUDIX family)